jgi:mutator protein MutT
VRKQVVGAAIVRGRKVLATRRTTPPELGGRWELPGGKVEPGELPGDALEREVAEELRCTVEVTGWLDGVQPIGETHELRVATARISGGEPAPVEHDAVRWLGADELDEVDWLEPDRPFLPQVAAALRETPPTTLRAILFEEDDATAVLTRLRGEGYDAWLERERLAGEDDDEDHPWAVLTDAPEMLVELLVDDHDGWLDREQDGPVAGSLPQSPLALPTQPRRIKREGTDD